MTFNSIPPEDDWKVRLVLWLIPDELRYHAVQETLTGASTAMATVTPGALYRLIYELGNAFACQLELDALLELVTQKCREVLEAEGAAILLLDSSGEELYFPYLADLDPEIARRLAGLRFSALLGIAGEALRSGRALKIDDVSREEHFYSLIDRHTGLTTRSILAAPLIFAGTRLGVVEVVNSLRGNSFSDDDLVLLESLANSKRISHWRRIHPIFGDGRSSVPSQRYQFWVGCIINTYGSKF